MKIHSTAIIHPNAAVPDNVEIGPYCVIGDRVRLGEGTRLMSNVIVEGPTVIGEDNTFFPFSSIGSVPQDLKYRGEDSKLEIGHRNRVREFVTINRGTQGGGMLTRIGNDNLLMAYAHIAHDCRLGNSIILGNAVTLGGHVLVENGASIGAFSGVHQFCRVGAQAFIGGYSVITRDALPFVKSVGVRGDAKAFGINTIGLRRKMTDPERIASLKRAYRAMFQSKMKVSDAVAELCRDAKLTPEVEILVQFVQSAERGFIR